MRSKNENIKITLKDLESLPCLFALSINGQYVIAFWKVAHDPFEHLDQWFLYVSLKAIANPTNSGNVILVAKHFLLIHRYTIYAAKSYDVI